ncbi:MAG: hypothetical protein HUU06_09415 [Planctomycetaceae bacterium]|nr:hypothetical protein [Planctomycetota bacterium]NUN52986.1 hypothetical protein [Planctomycetaceae bacterium]
MRAAALALLLLAAPSPAPAAREDGPVVDATPEAKALVARFYDLLHGPAMSRAPLDEDIHVVVGGKEGAAAVALTVRLRIDPGARRLRLDGPTEGDLGVLWGNASLPATGSIDLLLGGALPFPADAWKGRVDEAGVLHAHIGTEGRWTAGTETTFDGRGLPVSAVCLQPGKDGVLLPGTRAETRWEPAGKRYRMTEVTISGKSRVILQNTFAWGPVEETLPRRWTVLQNDRVCRFRLEGEEALPAGTLDPLMTYFLDPQPEAFLERLAGFGDRLLAPQGRESDVGELHAVALSAILRAEPSRFPWALKGLAGAGPGPGRVLLRAIAYAGGPDLGRRLDEAAPLVAESVRGEVEALRGGLPHPLESPVPMSDVMRGAVALDRCWSLYFASGDPAALRPIVGALRGLDTAVPGKAMTGEMVGAVARWSLVSNARQVPGVRECLERDLSVVPANLRPHLEQVLAKAAAPMEGEGRVEPEGGTAPGPEEDE